MLQPRLQHNRQQVRVKYFILRSALEGVRRKNLWRKINNDVFFVGGHFFQRDSAEPSDHSSGCLQCSRLGSNRSTYTPSICPRCRFLRRLHAFSYRPDLELPKEWRRRLKSESSCRWSDLLRTESLEESGRCTSGRFIGIIETSLLGRIVTSYFCEINS